MKYFKILQTQALPKYTKIGIFGLKIYIFWQPWAGPANHSASFKFKCKFVNCKFALVSARQSAKSASRVGAL
jgi:hypothetical protein